MCKYQIVFNASWRLDFHECFYCDFFAVAFELLCPQEKTVLRSVSNRVKNSRLNVSMCRSLTTPDSVSAWEEAMENSLIEQKSTVYASDIQSATTTAVSSQRLQDFSWMSVAKSEPVPGLQSAELYNIQHWFYYGCRRLGERPCPC